MNTRIWLSEYWAGHDWALLTEDGTEVPFTMHRFGTEQSYDYVEVFTPIRLLQPDQTYELWSGYQALTDQVTWFTTGTDIAEAPPTLPTETRRTSRGFNPCAALCADAGAEVDIWLTGADLIVVDVGDEATLVPEDPSGLVTLVTQDGHVHMDTLCSSWPGKVNQRKSIRYGTFDLAGNFSGWTEPTTVRMPGVPAVCTCSTAPRTTPLLWVLLVLLLAWRRRAALRSTTRR